MIATHPYMVGRVLFGGLIIFAQPIFLYNMWMTAKYGKKIEPVKAGGQTAPAPATG